MKKIKANKGISIVEALVFLGVMSFIGLAMAQVVANLRNVSVFIEMDSAADDIQNSVQRILMNKQACISTINPRADQNVSITENSFDFYGNLKQPLTDIFDEYYYAFAKRPAFGIFTSQTNPGTTSPAGPYYNRHFFSGGRLELAALILKKTAPLMQFAGVQANPGYIPLNLSLVFKRHYGGGSVLGGRIFTRTIKLYAQDVKGSDGAVIGSACTSLPGLSLAQNICSSLGGINQSGNYCDLTSSSFLRGLVCKSFGLGNSGNHCI